MGQITMLTTLQFVSVKSMIVWGSCEGVLWAFCSWERCQRLNCPSEICCLWLADSSLFALGMPTSDLFALACESFLPFGLPPTFIRFTVRLTVRFAIPSLCRSRLIGVNIADF